MSRSFSGTGSLGSPIKFPVSSGLESKTPQLSSLREKMDVSMEHLILGPMPVNQFLDEFLPKPKASRPRTRKKLFSDAIPENVNENLMYKPYMKVITDNKLIPGFKIVNTSYHVDQDIISGPGLKPDPSVYREDLDVSKKVTQFGELELHSELKPDDTDDAFVDPPQGHARSNWTFESRSAKGKKSRSQLIHYATEWFARQHRHHAFTIFLFGTYVRFIRWDRAGVIVSERFDFRIDCTNLLEFLWRFSHLDDAGRGKDPFVRRANRQEEKLARKELAEWKPEAERPVIVFTVPAEDGKDGKGKVREFLAWGCMSEPRSLTGRSTRTYPVYEVATKQKYLLKDAWRAHSLTPEAEILRELRDKKVEHVPVYLCGGDVPNGATQTDLYVTVEEANESWKDEDENDQSSAATSSSKLDGSWKCGSDWQKITQRFHHRFVSSVIGKPLKTFRSSKHMVEIVWHAFIAHWQAYQRCRIIHRDVSANNILITSSGGILNDWDMAKNEDDIHRSRRHERTGTWEFMSSLLLGRHHAAHTIQDDMESFVLVIIYNALRYFDHNKRGETLRILDKVFNDQDFDAGQSRGGEARKHLFLQNDYIGHDFQLTSPPLNRWVRAGIRSTKEWIETELAKSDSRNNSMANLTGMELMTTVKNTLPVPLPAATANPPPMQPRVFDNHEILCVSLAHCFQALDWPAPDDKPYDILPELRAAKRKRELELDNAGSGSSRKRSKASTSGSRGRGSETKRSSQIRTSGTQSHSGSRRTRK